MTLTQLAARAEAGDDVRELAEHHWRQGMLHAKAAASNAPWYHGHAQDTAKAAHHFTVHAALCRAHDGGGDAE